MGALMYGRIDADDVGDKLELLLLRGDIDGAAGLQRRVQHALAQLSLSLRSELGAEILFVGCDDILFRISWTRVAEQRLEALRDTFQGTSGSSFSCGLGADLDGALRNLRIAKYEGKARTIAASADVE